MPAPLQVETKWGAWDGYQLTVLKDCYAAARRDSQMTFKIGEDYLLTDFAKYLIHFLEMEGLKPL